MIKVFYLICLFLCSLGFSAEQFCYFTSPKTWDIADPHQLASHVKIGFIGKGKKGFNPSINLASEAVSLSLSDYVKKVRSIHEADRKNHWRDLGKYQTAAGEARLTEIETSTEWGVTRLLQLLLVKEGQAYILTACAIKEEFSDYYKEFQQAFRTLTLVSDPLDLVPPSADTETLKEMIAAYKKEPKDWEPVQKMIMNHFSEMGACWQLFTLKSLAQNKPT